MLKTIDDVSKLVAGNYRPINEATVAALMDSIREVGIREPIRVVETEDTRELVVVAGHHRVEAVRRLKAMNPAISYALPALVTKGKKADLGLVDAQVSMVIGNVFAPSAHLVDRALGYKRLREAGLSAVSIARAAGVSENLVHKTLAVAELSDEAKEWLRKNPKLNDSAVYAAAAKIKREGGGDIAAILSKTTVKKASTRVAAQMKASRGATVPTKVVTLDVGEFEQTLRTKAKLPEAVIQKVLAAL
jgi:ParB-like chromosome segregation protein Spo0J